MTDGDRVDELLGELEDVRSVDDPNVLVFHCDMDPCVAKVGDELRLLSSALVQARRIDEDEVRIGFDRHGEPDVVPISTQSYRLDASAFEDVADLSGPATDLR